MYILTLMIFTNFGTVLETYEFNTLSECLKANYQYATNIDRTTDYEYIIKCKKSHYE
jgi:hypothetical protein